MHRHIDEVEFVIFDTETTGLSPAGGDRVIEIAAVRFKGAQKLASFQSLVNPHRLVSPGAYAVNKISDAMLKGAPDAKAVIPDFLRFIEGACVCSYNAGFDLGFLNNELSIIGKGPLEGTVVVDVLKMSRRLLPNIDRHALWYVAEHLGVAQQQAHRALGDVEITYEVFHRLKGAIAAKGVSTFAQFSQLFAINKELLLNVNEEKRGRIQQAIDLKMSLRLKYLSSAGGQITEREVAPKELKVENGRDYLIGYCSLRQDERTFRVDNIVEMEVV
jgi:DNA polymerase III epsilon subunit family exonuclease